MKRFLKNGSKIFRSGPMKFWCRPSMSNMMILNRFVSYDFLSKPIVFAVEGGAKHIILPPPSTKSPYLEVYVLV